VTHTQFLPEPQRGECSRLQRDYVDLRVRVATLQSLSEMQDLVRRSEGIQEDALWKEATSVSLSLFVQSLSELTDLQIKRVRATVWNRIPPTIVLTLYGIAFLALTAMGYGAGLSDSRTTVPSLMLILTFSAIIVLIVDLERPRQQLPANWYDPARGRPSVVTGAWRWLQATGCQPWNPVRGRRSRRKRARSARR
jgi:hypothetical protein